MKFDLFELEFVDKYGNLVTTEEWLAGRQGTWELKHRILGTIVLFILAILSLPILIIAFAILSINKFCFHEKSLFGMLDEKTKKEQWYCNICKKIYLKKGKKR